MGASKGERRSAAGWTVTLLHRSVSGARFAPVWVSMALLVLVAAVVAPESLSSQAMSAVLPFGAFLAVAALGQMLVIMTGGIDLSVPAVITMAGTVLLGVTRGSDARLVEALLVCLALAALVGLVNGLLVGLVKLNPLVVTLAMGGITLGLTIRYRSGLLQEAAVPPAMASWAAGRLAGLNHTFWVGVLVTVVLSLLIRRTAVGRRFQAVGANPVAAWINGIHVSAYQVGAYCLAGILYGVAGLMLAAFIRNPTLGIGDPYLLGPIAAVVIGGASLAGGVASPVATWMAAMFLTQLTQMLRILGFSSALQFLVFGLAIAGGMWISGDRVAQVLSRVAARVGTHGAPETGAAAQPREADRGDAPSNGPVRTA